MSFRDSDTGGGAQERAGNVGSIVADCAGSYLDEDNDGGIILRPSGVLAYDDEILRTLMELKIV